MRRHQSKVQKEFLITLLRLFLILCAIGSFCIGILWIGLDYYESTTPNGALIQYTNLIANEQYDEIYEESQKVYTQYNSKDEYINYLKEFYAGYDLSKAAFTKKSYDASDYQYYDMSIDGQVITSLEIKKDDKKNKWNVRTLTEARSFRIDTTLSDLDMSINGFPIQKNQIVLNKITSKAYENLDDPTLSPSVDQYYIDNMIEVPTIDVANPDYIIVKDALLDHFYAGIKPTGSQLSEYEELIEKVAKTYSMYITEDETFANLRKLLYTKTSFYDAIRSFNNSFFSSHDRIEFGEMNIYDIVEIGENGLIGSVSFDYTIYIGQRSQTYSNIYQMTFLNIKDQWLLTNLVLTDS